MPVRTVAAKVRLLRQYGCLGPAVRRGVGMLARGDVRGFARRLARGTADAREMSPDAVRAAEAAAWWTRPSADTIVTATRPYVFAADVAGVSGYGHLAFALLTHLRRLGFVPHLHPAADVRPDLVQPSLFAPGPPPADAPTLIIAEPFRVAKFAPDGRAVVFTMWETDALPAEWVATLNLAGRVIVPSRWVADGFRASGVTVPVDVVPLGCDTGVFAPSPAGSAHESGEVVFGTAGALAAGGERKNVQRVIDAFHLAFPTEPGVRLRVKLSPASRMVETGGDPRVEVIRAVLTPGELAGWYRSLTAFVSASAAEGFGLHLLETMACGVPLVSAAFSGETEFFDGDAGYVLPHRVVPARGEVYAGRWAEVTADDVAAAMREVARDVREARRRGARAAARAGRFTWAETARRVAAVVGDLDPRGATRGLSHLG